MATTALLSIDNTRTFEEKSLNELYVQEGEQAAEMTYKIMDIVRKYNGLLYNVFEVHPQGHLSLASNYINKKIYSDLTAEEVNSRTDGNN